MKLWNNKTTLHLLGILLLFIAFCSYFLTTKNPYIHWDEAVYISMGKYIWSLGEQGLFESIRPLGLAILVGGLWKLGFGIIAYHVLTFIFGTGTLIVTYMLTKELLNKEAALWATLILATTPFFLQSSFGIMTEIPAGFFIVLVTWAIATKKPPFVIGCLASLVFLFKFPAGVILIAILIIAMIQAPIKILTKRSPILYIVAGFFLIQLPIFVMNYIMYKEYTATFIEAILRPIILAKMHAYNFVYSIYGTIPNLVFYPQKILTSNPLLMIALIGIVALIWNQRKKAHYILIPLIILASYFTIITNKQLRFAVLFLPFVAILAGYGIEITIQKLHSWTKTRKGIIIVVVLLIGGYLMFPQIQTTYRFFPAEETTIEQEYYSYFNDKVPTTILTTDPAFTAYTDNLLAIPYYNDATDGYELFHKHIQEVDYVVFNNDFFPCQNDECQATMDRLEYDISVMNELVYEAEWSGSIKRIYRTT